MKQNGFSLIECMIYCTILTIIMMLLFNGIVFFTRLCTTHVYKINSLSSVYTALDVLTRDIRKAQRTISLWPFVTDNAFVFKQHDSDFIGWEYQDEQLIRSQGDYDRVNKQWIKRTKSLVLHNIQKCFFSINRSHQNITSIEVMCVVQGKTFNRINHILT